MIVPTHRLPNTQCFITYYRYTIFEYLVQENQEKLLFFGSNKESHK